LIESSMSVKEICYELNYTSTEHFFSVFKKRTNFTPTEYRNFGRGGKEKENENE
jgi:transcriptional regulator